MAKVFKFFSQLFQLGVGKEEIIENVIEKIRINIALIFSAIVFFCLGYLVNRSFESNEIPLYGYFWGACGVMFLLIWFWNYFGMHHITRYLGAFLYVISMLVYSLNLILSFSEEKGLHGSYEWLFYFLLIAYAFYVFISFSTHLALIGVLPPFSIWNWY